MRLVSNFYKTPTAMNTICKTAAAALVAASTFASLSAEAQVYIGAQFGRPHRWHRRPVVVYAPPPQPVVYAMPPAVCGPAYAPAPVYMAPPPVVVAPPPYGYYRHGHHRRGW